MNKLLIKWVIKWNESRDKETSIARLKTFAPNSETK